MSFTPQYVMTYTEDHFPQYSLELLEKPAVDKFWDSPYKPPGTASNLFGRDWIHKQLKFMEKTMALPAACMHIAAFTKRPTPFTNTYVREEGDYTGLGADRLRTKPKQKEGNPTIQRCPKQMKREYANYKSSPNASMGHVMKDETPGSIYEKERDPAEEDLPYFKNDLPVFPTHNDDESIIKYTTAMTDVRWLGEETRQPPDVHLCYLWQRDYKPSPIIQVSIDQEPRKNAMMDTGATVTLMSYSWFCQVKKFWSVAEYAMRKLPVAPRVFGISGAELNVIGTFLMSIKIGKGIYPHEVVVIKAPGEEYNPTGHKIDMIIGVDFMRRFRVKLSFGVPSWKHKGYSRDYVYVGKQKFKALHTYDPTVTRFVGGIRIQDMNLIKDVEQEYDIMTVHQKDDIEIPSHALMWITFQPENPKRVGVILPQLVCLGTIILGGYWNEETQLICILYFNANEGAYGLEAGEQVNLLIQGRKMPTSKEVYHVANVLTTQDTPEEIREARWNELLEIVVEQARELDSKEKQRLRKLILKYKPNFRLKQEPPGLAKDFEVKVELTSEEPIHIPQYRLPEAIQDEVQKQTDEMVKHGVAKMSMSRYNFPIVPVPKKALSNEGKEVKETRTCVNLIALNEKTVIKFFIVPLIESTFSSLAGSCYFSSLDILSAFWHIPLHPDSCKYFAFSTTRGHYEYNRIPFGWVNSPFYFQHFSQTRIANKHPESTQVYIDDVMVHSKDKEKHFTHLDEVLDTISSENIMLKLAKCAFFQPELKYLGHIISRRGIQKDPEKVMAVLNSPPPRSKKESRRLMGMLNYYGNFMENLAIIGKPIWETTSQSDKVKFVWTDECEAARQTLLKMLARDVVLELPNPNKPFVIVTDASEYGIGAKLAQKDDAKGVLRPIMFISKSLDATQRKYTVTEKELYAIVHALKKFKPYIFARKFEIITDHRALIWLCGKKDPSARLGRWSQSISEYAQHVTFMAGKLNKVADALSRAPFVSEEDTDEMENFGSNPCLSAQIKAKIAQLVGIDLEQMKKNEKAQWDLAYLEHAQKTYEEGLAAAEAETNPSSKSKKRAKDVKDIKIVNCGSPTHSNREEEHVINLVNTSDNENVVNLIRTDDLLQMLKEGQQELEERVLFPTLTPELWGRGIKPHEIPRYVEQDETTKILRYKYKDGETSLLWVPPKYRRDVLRLFHYHPTKAHPSGDKMYQDIKQLMNWRGAYEESLEWVRTCEHCQRFRRDRNDRPQFQERRLPTYPMQRISMDFLSLESSTLQGDFRVLVIVDDLTRYAEAFVVPNERGETAANVLMENIICRYGVPEEVITDQGSAFISDLFETMCYQLAVDKIFTSAYHPQGNGINERMHSTLYTILRSLTGNVASTWKKQLPYALYVYRTTIHKAIGMSPHKALYGYSPRFVALDELPVEGYFPLDDRVKGLIEIHERCKRHLEQQQLKRNMDYNERRSLRDYEPGDLVKLRIHDRNFKLSPFWKGPFEVVRKVSPVNYEIDLPSDTNMSRIIHSQHMRPWYSKEGTDWDNIPVEKPPVQQIKLTKRERKQSTDVRNRPITRAYQKIIDAVDKQVATLKPVFCTYNWETNVPIRYLSGSEEEIKPQDQSIPLLIGEFSDRDPE